MYFLRIRERSQYSENVIRNQKWDQAERENTERKSFTGIPLKGDTFNSGQVLQLQDYNRILQIAMGRGPWLFAVSYCNPKRPIRFVAYGRQISEKSILIGHCALQSALCLIHDWTINIYSTRSPEDRKKLCKMLYNITIP